MSVLATVERDLRGTALPARLYRDPEVLAQFPFYANIEKLLSGATRTTPQIPEYAQVDDIIGVACSKAIAEEMSAKAALDDAAAKVEDLMRKAGYYK